MKLTHHFEKHDYKLCHFPNWCFNYNSIVGPLIEIYFQLSTKSKWFNLFDSPKKNFKKIKIVVETIVESDM
jgi:hypothetical protein